MPSMSACLLGSINLSEYVLYPFTSDAKFDFNSLEKDVFLYVDALNECLEENTPFMPIEEQRIAAAKYRAIGLGYFGVGDMFIKMGIRYGSEESIKLADKIGYLVATSAMLSSDKLYDKYPTPEIIEKNEEKIYNSKFFKAHFKDGSQLLPVNTSLLTSAPTGTLSTMLNVSGGIEPIFSLTTWRKTESLNGGKETYYEIDVPVVEEWKKINGVSATPAWISQSTALNQKIDERIEMQAAWQKHIDNAISSTVNLAEETTVEQVMDLYMTAWKMGLKGITVFRTGCKRGAILTEKKKEEKPVEVEVEVETTECGLVKEPLKWGETISCSNDLIGLKRKIMSGCGSLHIGAFYDWDGRLQEVFFNKGSDGGCNAFMVGLSRMTSLAARTGASIEKIVDQLASVPACASYVVRIATKHDTSKGKNCPNAIGNALLDMQKEVEYILKKDAHPITRSIVKMELIDATNRVLESHKGKTEQQCIDEGICPLCYKGGEEVNLVAGQGCFSCSKCGFSKCE